MKAEINSERWMNPQRFSREIWKKVDVLPDTYRVSNRGRVKREENGEYKILYSTNNGKGYYTIPVGHNKFYIHRLVALAFVENPYGHPEIDHINGIRDDNRPENLRWVNRSMNMSNPTTMIKRRGEKFATRNMPIEQIDKAGNVVKEWESMRVAAKGIGMSRYLFSKILNSGMYIDGFSYRKMPTPSANEREPELPEVNSERWLNVANFKNEVWRVVHDSEQYGKYSVSNYGRVKRAAFSGGRYRWPEMIFRTHLSRDNGYYRVRVAGVMCAVHRLVAEAFIANPCNHTEIDHINRKKTDNRVKNLRWVSHGENMQNIIKHNKPSKESIIINNRLKQMERVARIDAAGRVVEQWDSIKEAADAAGISRKLMKQRLDDFGWVGQYRYKLI